MSGIAVDEDGDLFYEDDFPDFEDEEFRQLEQNAISFTQREQTSRASRTATPQDMRTAAHDSGPLQRSHTLSVSAVEPQPYQRQATGTNLQRMNNNAFDSTLDEDGLPLVVEERPLAVAPRIPDETTQREQWRRSRFGQPAAPVQNRPLNTAQRFEAPAPRPQQTSNLYPEAARLPQQPTRQLTDSITSAFYEEEALRTRIEELTASLTRSNDELLARKGEIQILRANQTAGQKVHQRELSALRKLKQEETEKHKAAIDVLEEEKANTVSSIQFLKKELNDESRKVESLQRQLKERTLKDNPSNINTTPKRNNKSLRDGFDDEDIMVISPAKSGRRSNKGTPTANRKRKQPGGNDFHVQPLILRPSASGNEVQGETTGGNINLSKGAPTLRKDKDAQRHLRLVQQVLSFNPPGSQQILIERLAQFSFPSDTTKTFSSTVVTETAALSGQRLPGNLLQIFINLWTKALQEKYYDCIALLIDVVSFILEADPFVVDEEIIANLLPLIQSTININAVSRFHVLVKKDWLENPEVKKPHIDERINCTACLDLLFTLACIIADDRDLIDLFWRTTSTDFVLMMLNAAQPISDITLMLQILATSILHSTFGNICPLAQQVQMESYIVDRICYLLWENPKQLPTHKPYSRSAVCGLRLEALDLLTKLTMTSAPTPYDPSTATNHGTTFLANHPTAIARLVRSIYDEVSAMYLVTPNQHLHASLVNKAVHILYFTLNSPAGEKVDLQRKLAGTNGGAHRHRVVLTRLAFSEGTYIDCGITEETVRMATDLLEDSITPVEANDLTAAFGGVTGRSGSTQQPQR